MGTAVKGNGAAKTHDPRVVQFTIPSRLQMLSILDQLVQAITQQMDFDEDDANSVATSVIEAGTNAIQHGHNEVPEKPVSFRFQLGDSALEVWVEDQGPGFDLATLLEFDPSAPESLFSSHGRGIFIMKAMMDEVDFDVRKGQGVTVHLVKHRTPRPAS